MQNTRELRFTNRAEVRTEGASRFVSGYAARFGVDADIAGYTERISPGAFKRAIKEKQDVKFLVNHDPSLLLGRVSNKTLELSEDSKGLKFRCDVARTSMGDDVLALVRRGDLGECSFGFMAITDSWSEEKAGGITRYIRTLADVDLFDCSAVTYPAYSGTAVNADDESSRMAFMFAGGAPSGAPVELRSRISRAIQISDAEFLERFYARKAAERMIPDEDHGNGERLARLAEIRRSL